MTIGVDMPLYFAVAVVNPHEVLVAAKWFTR